MPKPIKVTALTLRARVQLQQIEEIASKLDSDAAKDLTKRAQAMLLLSEKCPEIKVAEKLNTTAPTVRRWRKAFEDAPGEMRIQALMGLRWTHGRGVWVPPLTASLETESAERLGKFRSDFDGGVPDVIHRIRTALGVHRYLREASPQLMRDKANYLPCIVLGYESIEVGDADASVSLRIPFAIHFDYDFNASCYADICTTDSQLEAFMGKIAEAVPSSESVKFIASPVPGWRLRTVLPNTPDGEASRSAQRAMLRKFFKPNRSTWRSERDVSSEPLPFGFFAVVRSFGPHARKHRSEPKEGGSKTIQIESISRLVPERLDEGKIREKFPHAVFWSSEERADDFRKAFPVHTNLPSPIMVETNHGQQKSYEDASVGREYGFYQRWGEACVVDPLIRFLGNLKKGSTEGVCPPPDPHIPNVIRNQLDEVSEVIWRLPPDEQDVVVDEIRRILNVLKESPPAYFINRIDGVEDGREEERSCAYKKHIDACRKRLDAHVKRTRPPHPLFKMGFPCGFGRKILSSYFNDMAREVLLEVNLGRRQFDSPEEAMKAINRWGNILSKRLNSKKFARSLMSD